LTKLDVKGIYANTINDHTRAALYVLRAVPDLSWRGHSFIYRFVSEVH